ncbi:MAG: hypothetical protein J6Q38_02320 [Clostridia bacterium]|nr:hypothetical protein [Clostridia bacterium]
MGAIYYKGEKYGAMPASAANLPISASDTTDTKSYIDNGLNGKQAKIMQTTISGTTDGTGDLSLTGLPITQYRVISCIKVRNTANPDVAYCVLGGYSTGTSLPYAHLINSSNANYANKAVEVTVNYIAL